MKFAHMPHSTCSDSARKWTQQKQWISKHSLIKMAQLAPVMPALWALAFPVNIQVGTCTRDRDHSQWWELINIKKIVILIELDLYWTHLSIQLQPRANRYARKNSQGGQSSIYTPAPEYDDPANCAEEDQYVRVSAIWCYGLKKFILSFPLLTPISKAPIHSSQFSRWIII